MYLIVTRSFPPQVGGMQNLMWGLTKELSRNFMLKVFADYQDKHKIFDGIVQICDSRLKSRVSFISTEESKQPREIKNIF